MDVFTMVMSASRRLINDTATSATRCRKNSSNRRNTLDLSCASRFSPCRMYMLSSMAQRMLAWIVTKIHMTVTRTAEPMRGLSVCRDTMHTLEALKLGQKGRHTYQIDRYEVDTCVYSVAQYVEDA